MVGKRLKELREEKGLTQKELSEMVNLSQQTIGHYEVDRAEPGVKTLEIFARIFNTTVDYLLGISDIRTPPEIQAAHRTDDPMDELPPEARKSLEEFKAYIIEKYKNKDRNNPT